MFSVLLFTFTFVACCKTCLLVLRDWFHILQISKSDTTLRQVFKLECTSCVIVCGGVYVWVCMCVAIACVKRGAFSALSWWIVTFLRCLCVVLSNGLCVCVVFLVYLLLKFFYSTTCLLLRTRRIFHS